MAYIRCIFAGQKPLAIMAKLITAFICVDIALRVVMPIFYSIKDTAQDIQKKVYNVKQKVEQVEKLPEKVPTDKDIIDWLKEQLKDPELNR